MTFISYTLRKYLKKKKGRSIYDLPFDLILSRLIISIYKNTGSFYEVEIP